MSSAGRQHGHAGHRPHDRQVVDHLVGLARQAGQDAAVAGRDLDPQVGLGDGHPELVEGAGHGEAGERADARDAAHGGQPGRHADQVLLGDAHLQELVRGSARPRCRPGWSWRGRRRGPGSRVACQGHGGQGLAEDHALRAERRVVGGRGHGDAGRIAAGGAHRRSSTSSARAWAASSSVGTRACHSKRPSMNDTPRPLTVSARTTVGPAVAGRRQGAGQAVHDGPHVVPVEGHRPPAEGGPDGGQLLGRPRVAGPRPVAGIGPAELLQAVDSRRWRSGRSSRWRAADDAASQTRPSWHSPSPSMTTTRPSRSRIRAPMAIPARPRALAERARGRVEAGQAGHVRDGPGAGCRWRRRWPAPRPGSSRDRASTMYSPIGQWPFDRMNRSRSGQPGSSGRIRRTRSTGRPGGPSPTAARRCARPWPDRPRARPAVAPPGRAPPGR